MKAVLLATCLDDLATGRAGPECRSRTAVRQAGLEPLLAVAQQLQAVRHPKMETAALEAGLARVQGGSSRRKPASARHVRWVRRVVWAMLALALAFLLSTTGTVMAAEDSLPGDLLYPVKRAAEDVRLSLTHQPEARSSLLIALADRRLEEVAQLCPRGSCPANLLADLVDQTEAAAAEIERLPEGKRAELLQKMVDLTERQQGVLAEVLEKAPESARAGLERAMERSRHGHQRALEALDREKKTRSETPGPPEKDHTPGPPERAHTPGPPEKERTPGRPEGEHTPGPPEKAHTPGPKKTVGPDPSNKDE